MTQRFKTFIGSLIEDEGRYVNDPNDSGGHTKWGLTLAFLRDRVDSGFTVARLKAMGQEEAEQIYYDTIWSNPYRTYVDGGMEALPRPVGEVVFNIAVNAGEDDGYEALQETLDDMGYDLGRAGVDRKLGSTTVRQTARAFAARPERVLEGIGQHLINHYDKLIAGGYGRTFKSGWNRRAAGLMVEAGVMLGETRSGTTDAAEPARCSECGADVEEACDRKMMDDDCPRKECS